MPYLAYTTGATAPPVIWQCWITGGTNSTIVYTDQVWLNWTETPGTSLTIDTNAVWSQWARGTDVLLTYPMGAQDEPLREEERAARAERTRLAAEQQQEEESERQEADARALVLLQDHLSEEQHAELARDRHFHVVSKSGTRYRITYGSHGNVLEMREDNQAIASYCIQPVGRLPHPDAMLAQKFLLETDEEAFLRIANRTARAAL